MDKDFLKHFMLKVGDCVLVKAFAAPKDKDEHPLFQRWESRVPYKHFRLTPVSPGFYVVTAIWMHPKAVDPEDPNSYCYTLHRVKTTSEPNEFVRWTNYDVNTVWFEKQWTKGLKFQPTDLSKEKVNYNSLHWDSLIKEGIVCSHRYKDAIPEGEFNLDEFRADLGKLLYKHKASLVAGKEYDGPWDWEGTLTLKVVYNQKGKTDQVDLGWKFPRRRSEPKPNLQ